MLAVVACALAIASVPVFSHQASLSLIPQLLALVAVGLAGLTLLVYNRIPRVHPSIVAYFLLVGMWVFTVPANDLEQAQYLTLVKLAVLVLAVHLTIRTPRHILLVFGAYSMCGLIALTLNWNQINEMRAMMAAEGELASSMRFDGTFANANRAGIFAMNVILCSLLVFFSNRNPLRWSLLASGVFAGVIIGGLSGSRKAMLGIVMIAAASPFLAFSGDRDQLLKWIKGLFFSSIALIIALGVLSQTPYFDRFSRLAGGFSEADESALNRMEMLKAAIDVWQAHPIAGAGFQGFARVSGFGGYSHTTFGEVLANGGLIGFLLISAFYLVPPVQILLCLNGRSSLLERKLAFGLLAFCGLFAMNSLFSVQYQSRDMIPMWAAVCGLIQAQYSLRNSNRVRAVYVRAHSDMVQLNGS